jgi:hypothetical protein
MRKHTIHHTSPLDALVAVAKRLSAFERQHEGDSETFFDRYSRGKLGDDAIYIEWANDYRHYLAIRRDLESPARLTF